MFDSLDGVGEREVDVNGFDDCLSGFFDCGQQVLGCESLHLIHCKIKEI